MVIEVMGREAGWIALHSGLAAGADVVLIPEIPFAMESIFACIRQREIAGKNFTILVVAEGVKLPESEAGLAADGRSVASSGTAARVIGESIARGIQRETRVTVLGHIQRGGSPSPFDRILCTRFGAASTDLIARGEFGRMVCLRAGAISSVDIAEAAQAPRCVDPNSEIVRMARAIGVCFGD
jgi:6-phosphofructokinase 1